MSEISMMAPGLSPGEAIPKSDKAAGAHRIGPVRVNPSRDGRIELHVPGELGWGRAIVGLVPIVWCAAAWLLCVREHLLAERLKGCVALTLMAVVSGVLMLSSMGATWRFDGRRRSFSRWVGLLVRTHNARRLAGVRVELTRPSVATDTALRLIMVDATGQERFLIAQWKRREVDRGLVDELATAIRTTMGWSEA